MQGWKDIIKHYLLAARESTEIHIHKSSVHPHSALLSSKGWDSLHYKYTPGSSASELVHSKRDPETCAAFPPWHGCTTFAILFVILLKGNKENTFQIFLISVISCTHQVILQGPVPHLNFRIAFQPIITRICLLGFQDSSSLHWNSFCSAYKYSLQHDHFDAHVILPITEICLSFTTYAWSK